MESISDDDNDALPPMSVIASFAPLYPHSGTTNGKSLHSINTQYRYKWITHNHQSTQVKCEDEINLPHMTRLAPKLETSLERRSDKSRYGNVVLDTLNRALNFTYTCYSFTVKSSCRERKKKKKKIKTTKSLTNRRGNRNYLHSPAGI